MEAALLSKAAGKPVKVVWTREDDIRFDYFHSVAAMHMKAAWILPAGFNRGSPAARSRQSLPPSPPVKNIGPTSKPYGP
jgi:hypothetical protein